MWMAEFCRRTGLTRDAVRFYERLGLLKPAVDRNNRYRCFADADVERIALLRAARQLGFSLRQIVPLSREFDAGALDTRRKLALLEGQLEMLDAQAARVQAMRRYVRAKIVWIEGGGRGPAPVMVEPGGSVRRHRTNAEPAGSKRAKRGRGHR